MSFDDALTAALTAFHFGDRATFVSALRFAQAAADTDAALVRHLNTAIAKFPANEALEIVNAARCQHSTANTASAAA